MKANTLNVNVMQMAANNWQLVNGNRHLATGKSMLATGCLQTTAGRKLLDSKPGKRQQLKGVRTNRP